MTAILQAIPWDGSISKATDREPALHFGLGKSVLPCTAGVTQVTRPIKHCTAQAAFKITPQAHLPGP